MHVEAEGIDEGLLSGPIREGVAAQTESFEEICARASGQVRCLTLLSLGLLLIAPVVGIFRNVARDPPPGLECGTRSPPGARGPVYGHPCLWPLHPCL